MEVMDILKKSGAELYPEDLAFFEAELDTGAYSIEYIDACKKLIGEIRAWKKQSTAQNSSDRRKMNFESAVCWKTALFLYKRVKITEWLQQI